MSLGRTNGGRGSEGREQTAWNLRPVLNGLLAVALVILTLLAAAVLTTQEQELIAGVKPTATSTATLPVAIFSPTPSLSQPGQPAPTPIATPLLSPSPVPMQLDLSPPLSQPTPSLTASPSRAPSPTETRRPSSAAAPSCRPSPPNWWRRYVVRRGDTLSRLAARYGASVSSLKQVNCLSSNRLIAGSRLWVPYRGPKPYGAGVAPPPKLIGDSPVPAVHSKARLFPIYVTALVLAVLVVAKLTTSVRQRYGLPYRLYQHARANSSIAGPWLLGAVICLLGTFGTYLLTVAPTVQGFDSAELATGAYLLGIVHATGYPLYLLLGKLFTYIPLGDIAYRLNLMSAVFATLTCVTVYGISFRLTKSWLVSLLGALFLGFSFYFWQSAVVAEVYTLQTFLTGALFLLLLKWDETQSDRALYLFAWLYGLSLGNHISGLLLAPGLAFLILSKRPLRSLQWRLVAGMALCFTIGLSVYLYLPLRYLADPPLNYVKSYYQVDLTTLEGLVWMVSGQMYRFFAFSYSLAEIGRELLRYVGWLWRNFLGVGIPIGLLGLILLLQRQRRWAIGLLLLLIPNIIFFANYGVVDKETMFLPAHMIWALFVPLGFSIILEKWSALRVSLPFSTVRRFGTGLLVSAAILLTATQALANEPWANYGDRWQWRESAEQVLANVEPNAVIASQWSSAVVLEYLQLVEGQRPDVTIFNRSRFGVAQFYQYWEQGKSVDTCLTMIEQEETALLDEQAKIRPVYIVDFHPFQEMMDIYAYSPYIYSPSISNTR